MHKLDLKIPPPILAIAIALLIWGSSFFLDQSAWSFRLRLSLFILFFAVGVSIILCGVIQFFLTKTTINPIHPKKTRSLICHGIYKYSRNPMYLGLSLSLTGWTLFFGHLISLFFVFIFIFYMTQFQIKPEERALREKFGTEFEDYKSRVRRWL